MGQALLAALLVAASSGQAAEIVASGPAQDGLQLSIAISREPSPRFLTMVLENQGDSPRALTVGSHCYYEDNWAVTATLLTPDGMTHELTYGPMKTGFVVSGNLRLFTISTRPHVPYRFDFVIDDFEVDVVARHSLKLSWFLGSGARLQFALHCGPDSHSGIKQNPWTGYLLSGWLTL